MSILSSNVISLSLVGSGVLAWAMAASPLSQEPDLRIPSNPLGVKRSPYGEVFAMAMQGPIDLYWHDGADCDEDHDHSEHDHGAEAHAHAAHDSNTCAAAATGTCPTCEANKQEELKKLAAAPPKNLMERFARYLDELHDVASTRTNPKPLGPAHRLAIRREMEDKLRFAYELDPSHYGNYNTYQFFLTEPSVGTRPELTPGAVKLAEATIEYCLSRDDDPRPSLTAASAAENELLLMFASPGRFTTAQMRSVLAVVDYSLARHHEISRRWEESGDWDNVSPMRQTEAAERLKFVTKLREATETTIVRLEKQNAVAPLLPLPTQASKP